jgi:hypothetical protein
MTPRRLPSRSRRSSGAASSGTNGRAAPLRFETKFRTATRPRSVIATGLALLAAFGLVVAPVLHAELHVSEVSREHDRAVAAAFRIAFGSNRGVGWRAELAAAVAEAIGERDAELPELEAAHHHRPGGQHRHHSHGAGPHGSGSLEHFALAIHAAAAPPPFPPPQGVPNKPSNAPLVEHLTPRYLVPEFSQGPPRASTRS